MLEHSINRTAEVSRPSPGKKMWRFVSASVLTVVLLFGPSHAQDLLPENGLVDGNNLLNLCELPMGNPGWTYCFGFIEGAIGGADVGSMVATAHFTAKAPDLVIGEADLSQVLGYCLPNGVNRRQLIDVVVKYMRDAPESRHLPATALVVASVREAFPCN